jgi:iron complex transport system ATP-binding protein
MSWGLFHHWRQHAQINGPPGFLRSSVANSVDARALTDGPRMISIHQMSPAPLLLDFARVTIARGDKLVLRDFSLQIRRGEHVVILGPNGSGKSTFIKALTRELYPVGGECDRFQVLGRDDWDVSELREHLGIVALDLLHNLSHEVTLREVTARELVLSGYFNSIGLWPHHRVTRPLEQQARRILRFLEIEHLANRPVAAMSSGEQRRAVIGRALVHEPEALILDEPTNSLDPGAVREFRRVLRKLARAGKSLILVTHHIADVIPEINRVILMTDGRIIADGAKARVLTSRALSRLFGTKLRVSRRGEGYELAAEQASPRQAVAHFNNPPGQLRSTFVAATIESKSLTNR